MPELTIKVDHIAALRRTRDTLYPDPVSGAVLAELAGADAIAAHLYEDRRHIQDRDVKLLQQVVQSRFTLMMAPSPQMVGIALEVHPDSVTLVPEKREEFSAGVGFDLVVHENSIAETVDTLQTSGIPVSIRIDPDPDQIKIAHRIDAAMVEIQTATFSRETIPFQQEKIFRKIVDAVKLAHKLKLRVSVGQGLCYHTIKPFIGLAEIDEFCIGHSIISRALMVGMEKAVGEMKSLIHNR